MILFKEGEAVCCVLSTFQNMKPPLWICFPYILQDFSLLLNAVFNEGIRERMIILPRHSDYILALETNDLDSVELLLGEPDL